MGSRGQVAEPPAFVRLAAHPLRWRLLTELAESDYRVRELVTRVDQPQNLVSYHLRLLRDGGLVTAGRSSADRRDSYYHLDLDRCARALADSGTAIHPVLRPRGGPAEVVERPRCRRLEVLFVCTGNSARSPIAEALLRHRAPALASATSAGTRPKSDLHPDAVRVLHEEFGIDVSGRSPRDLQTLADRRFDVVITLCDRAREACPEVSDAQRRVHWSVPDPATAVGGYESFRRTAADIATRVRHLLPVLSQRSEVEP
jgi:ArsR family transcriptional regulator, arsenate/arsenite/antimonite-responsive transcriptional repressor / arsenate reductase (thioredoxin)